MKNPAARSFTQTAGWLLCLSSDDAEMAFGKMGDMTTTQRKYAYIKIDKGDYLLASNDRQTILRFQAHDEDGSAEWGDGTKVIGTFWDVLSKPASAYPEDGFMFDVQMERWLDEGWTTRYSMSRSRKEAEHNVSDLIAGVPVDA